MLLFLGAIAVFVIIFGALFVRHYLNTQRRARSRWSHLLARLLPLNQVGIEIVAHDEHAKSLSNSEIWRMVDGMDGLDKIHHNSLVLLDIAAYALEWHPEAFDVAEQLRLKAQEIAWLVNSLRAAEANGSLESWFANYAQKAVASYSFMVQSLVPLLSHVQHSAVSEFQNAL